ncbi:MAG TPA: class I SAM-dependent methyltransferase [Methanothrix sp.]|nr:class I SAM-dependent methyltransferase [Methanothrix sp.]
MKNIKIFEEHAVEYDEWFDDNPAAYQSEVLALRNIIPAEGTGLEVGIGTGRFAEPLGIRTGVEPARAMAEIARKRGIDVHEARAEALPFQDESFDFLLMVTTICFLEEPLQALAEAKRVLKPGGAIIIGMIDRNSPLGKDYERRKATSKFYKYARILSVDQVMGWLESLDFDHTATRQTLFKSSKDMRAAEPFEEGHGRGAFVAIAAKKKRA